MRVVIDTNVLVSGVLNSSGPPARTLANEGDDVVWITTEGLLAEVQRVLARPYFSRRLQWDEERNALFVSVVRRRSVVIVPVDRVDASRDPDDNRVLEAAIAGEVDYVVTGDRDLLDLGSYEGIRMVTPAVFVELLPG